MTPQTRHPPKRRLPVSPVLLVGVAAVALAAILWAVAANGGDDNARGGAADDPGVAHVHGLGINPADGSLVVATHNGSFRLPAEGGTAERIGDSFQDTMGFTVAGPDHFLGSGHPDVAGMRAGFPGRMGLIESTDAGVTWTIVSLGGEVDFHALAFAHDQVYGWDSGTGRFMVSADRREWETRSTLDMVGFAVDPDDPDHVVAAGPAGLFESRNGGRAWSETEGPRLVTVSWDAGAGLWGAEPQGEVWHHTGVDWEPVGELPGQPQAFLATPGALFAAAHDEAGRTGIYQSTDDGRTWVLRYRDRQQ